MKPNKRLFVTDRDLDVLKFLWRWKLASTSALAQCFFAGTRVNTAYNRLLELEAKRFLRHVSFGYQKGGAWALDVHGFQFLNPHLLEMKSKGYRSENSLHDYYATAFHLGEWLVHKPHRSLLCSEQELRRLDPDLLPVWVPKSGNHRPDGYTAHDTGRGAHLYAFECELSQKSRTRYEETLTFYDEEETIAAVFWLTGGIAIEKAIQNCNSTTARPHLHHFVTLSDFQKCGWSAPLTKGIFNGKSLAGLLIDKAGTKPVQSPDKSSVSLLLESRKKPILPKESARARESASAD
jgi:hypothetical protein